MGVAIPGGTIGSTAGRAGWTRGRGLGAVPAPGSIGRIRGVSRAGPGVGGGGNSPAAVVPAAGSRSPHETQRNVRPGWRARRPSRSVPFGGGRGGCHGLRIGGEHGLGRQLRFGRRGCRRLHERRRGLGQGGRLRRLRRRQLRLFGGGRQLRRGSRRGAHPAEGLPAPGAGIGDHHRRGELRPGSGSDGGLGDPAAAASPDPGSGSSAGQTSAPARSRAPAESRQRSGFGLRGWSHRGGSGSRFGRRLRPGSSSTAR